MLGQLGRTPSFIMQPPKDHLVERASALLSYKLTVITEILLGLCRAKLILYDF